MTKEQVDFLKQLVFKFVDFDQAMKKKKLDAMLKWGGWLFGALALGIEIYFRTGG